MKLFMRENLGILVYCLLQNADMITTKFEQYRIWTMQHELSFMLEFIWKLVLVKRRAKQKCSAVVQGIESCHAKQAWRESMAERWTQTPKTNTDLERGDNIAKPEKQTQICEEWLFTLTFCEHECSYYPPGTNFFNVFLLFFPFIERKPTFVALNFSRHNLPTDRTIEL